MYLSLGREGASGQGQAGGLRDRWDKEGAEGGARDREGDARQVPHLAGDPDDVPAAGVFRPLGDRRRNGPASQPASQTVSRPAGHPASRPSGQPANRPAQGGFDKQLFRCYCDIQHLLSLRLYTQRKSRPARRQTSTHWWVETSDTKLVCAMSVLRTGNIRNEVLVFTVRGWSEYWYTYLRDSTQGVTKTWRINQCPGIKLLLRVRSGWTEVTCCPLPLSLSLSISLSLYIYIYIHVHILVHTYTYIYIYTHIHIHICSPSCLFQNGGLCSVAYHQIYFYINYSWTLCCDYIL